MLSARPGTASHFSGTADITGISFAGTSYTNTSMIKSFPYTYDGIGLYYRDSSSTRANMAQTFWHSMSFMKIFDWQIWVLMSISTAVVMILTIIGQGMEISRWVYCVWFVIANVLLSVFTNLMAINFVAPISQSGRPFSTLEDLGQKVLAKECRFVLPGVEEGAVDFRLELVNPKLADNPTRKLFQGKSLSEI